MTELLATLNKLAQAKLIRSVDFHFAEFLNRSLLETNDSVLLAATALSNDLSRQHSCLDLDEFCKRPSIFVENGSMESGLTPPSLSQLKSDLQQSHIVGSRTDPKPLVLDGSRLYFHRYFDYEDKIAGDLIARNIEDPVTSSIDQVRLGKPGTMDAVATAIALTRRLCIIVGGPGTGKTYTIVNILNEIATLCQGLADMPIIRLAAPTGKAAMRLQDAIKTATKEFSLPGVVTLHRLLGARPETSHYRYNSGNKLPLDILIVDEVSMMDLSMMASLLAALPEHARLILLGDPNQLPSVNIGNVLADLCKDPIRNTIMPAAFDSDFATTLTRISGVKSLSQGRSNRLRNCICVLTENHRFASDSGIGQLSDLVNKGDSGALPDLLAKTSVRGEISRLEVSSDSCRNLADRFVPFLDVLRMALNPANYLLGFDQFRILSATREGENGVTNLNKMIESELNKLGLIDTSETFYTGRPIMITRNDYNLGLFNGDIGVCFSDNQQQKACFLNEQGEVNILLTTRLPAHETCFAMTVHKSQGSEYKEVAIILDPDPELASSELFTRELLFTAITRARERILLYASMATLQHMIDTPSIRRSGLASALADAGETEATIRQLDLFDI